MDTRELNSIVLGDGEASPSIVAPSEYDETIA
jgi:hypothetical protein